jgi:hypothetical protein
VGWDVGVDCTLVVEIIIRGGGSWVIEHLL